jgi:hypothetical protein
VSRFDAATWAPLPMAQVAAAHDRVAALAAFEAWAGDAGIERGPVEIRLAADGGRGVFARRRVAVGEHLIVVPRHALITDVDVAATPVGAAMREVSAMLASPHSEMAVWLAHERAAPASPWRAYLDALPPVFPWMPMHRPASELMPLTGTRALEVIVQSAGAIRDERDFVVGAVAELAGLTLSAFAWGRCVMSSRCFHIDDEDGSVRALVPIVDMVDHGAPDAAWTYDRAHRRFEMYAVRALSPGDEIRHSYGPRGNATLLSGYGFALPENAEDEVTIALPSAEEPAISLGARPDTRFQNALTRARELAAPGGGPDAMPRALARFAAAIRAAAATIDAAPPLVGDDAWRATCAVVRAGEHAILDELLALIAQIPPSDAPA